MKNKLTEVIVRKKILINGIVQGVGFRPFIFREAVNHSLTGYVKNSIKGVVLEVEGNPKSIEQFFESISLKNPPLSEIISLESHDVEPEFSNEFKIITSDEIVGNQTLISPDVCICDDCLSEMFNKNDRRYLYPFINCTNCGPRLTIIRDIPYDRKLTTMVSFEMCDDCLDEYENPINRRFHAQPNACPVCGPKIWLTDSTGSIVTENNREVIKLVSKKLMSGSIAAIKGLGGYHLACDATNEEAVKTLRERKAREAKPLAIMVNDLDEADKITICNEIEKKLLTGYQRPIVLLKKKSGISVAVSVAPDNERLGIMLPYTPLHYLIFETIREIRGEYPVLIMTSANFSEEPIEINNESALKRLSPIADYFILHNRDILIRTDDSVVININNHKRFFRRSRGYVPKPVFLSKDYPKVLAVGAELKNTICILKNNQAFLSQHIGDLTNNLANVFFNETIEHLQQITNCKADYFAYDMHPNYLSSSWAHKKSCENKFVIQHHHAHMASCMVENNVDEDVIGVIFDGTGFGYDNNIWGGEFLVGNFTYFKRVAHLPYIKLPGGDKAVEEPWRVALSYLYKIYKENMPVLPFMKNKPINSMIEMINRNLNSPLSCGAGRLFDAVSVIAGGPEISRYEAEAAIYLTQKSSLNDLGSYNIDELQIDNLEPVIENIFRQIVEEKLNGYSIHNISTKFHKTIAELITNIVNIISEKEQIKKVVLSGGVFQNEILSTLVEKSLSEKKFDVYIHKKVPANDGGISLGQAVIAGELIMENRKTVSYIN